MYKRLVQTGDVIPESLKEKRVLVRYGRVLPKTGQNRHDVFWRRHAQFFSTTPPCGTRDPNTGSKLHRQVKATQFVNGFCNKEVSLFSRVVVRRGDNLLE